MCPYSYNPLLAGKLDITKKNLNDLEDVNTAGTANDKVLSYQNGTWIPQTPAGGGDMTRAVYDVNANDIVDNSERLEGETLGSVQAHTVDAINILGTLTDANIPDVETLSYGFTFADAQIPTLDATKIISGTFDAGQIPDLPTSRIATGTFDADRIPTIENLKGTVPDSKIPNVDDLSYGAAFATTQIPNLPTSKITSGTLAVARHETLGNLDGTVDLVQIPTMDDGHIPNLGASKITSGQFPLARMPRVAAGQFLEGNGAAADPVYNALVAGNIPNLAASKITTETFNADRIPVLPTSRYGSAVLLTGAQTIGGTKTFGDIPVLPASDPTSDNEAARKAYVDAQGGGGEVYYPYTGDETEVCTVSGTFASKKEFSFVKHGSVVTPATVRFACELKTTAGSYQMEITLGGGTAVTFTGTETSYKLRYTDYGVAGVSTGVVETKSRLRNIGAGTSYNRLYDAYLKY